MLVKLWQTSLMKFFLKENHIQTHKPGDKHLGYTKSFSSENILKIKKL